MQNDEQGAGMVRRQIESGDARTELAGVVVS